MTEPEHGPEAFERVAKPHLLLLWRCARRLVRTGHEPFGRGISSSPGPMRAPGS
jgi:hypothetical protein